MRLLIDLTLALAGVALFEGVVKPALAELGKTKTRKYVKRLFEITDSMIPTLMNEGSYVSLKQFINDKILLIEVEENDKLTEKQVALILSEWDKLYSPLTNAENLQRDPVVID